MDHFSHGSGLLHSTDHGLMVPHCTFNEELEWHIFEEQTHIIAHGLTAYGLLEKSCIPASIIYMFYIKTPKCNGHLVSTKERISEDLTKFGIQLRELGSRQDFLHRQCTQFFNHMCQIWDHIWFMVNENCTNFVLWDLLALIDHCILFSNP